MTSLVHLCVFQFYSSKITRTEATVAAVVTGTGLLNTLLFVFQIFQYLFRFSDPFSNCLDAGSVFAINFDNFLTNSGDFFPDFQNFHFRSDSSIHRHECTHETVQRIQLPNHRHPLQPIRLSGARCQLHGNTSRYKIRAAWTRFSTKLSHNQKGGREWSE